MGAWRTAHKSKGLNQPGGALAFPFLGRRRLRRAKALPATRTTHKEDTSVPAGVLRPACTLKIPRSPEKAKGDDPMSPP